MTIQEFKEYVKERKALSSDEIHQFMHDMSDEARRINKGKVREIDRT